MSATTLEWRELVSGLEGRRDALDSLSRRWEELETQWSTTEARLNATDERNKLVDNIVRSKQHLIDTAKSLDVST